MAETRSRKIRLDPPLGDHDPPVIELVSGPRPYLWIGDAKGAFIGSIDVSRMERFLRCKPAPTPTEEREAGDG